MTEEAVTSELRLAISSTLSADLLINQATLGAGFEVNMHKTLELKVTFLGAL